MVESAVVGALAGILGLALGRFWDLKSESTRWRRDQRVRYYENLVQAYYRVREMIRLIGAIEPGTKNSQAAADRARKAGIEWSQCVVAVWLYGSAPVTATTKELDSQFNHLLHRALARRLAWDETEWRRQRFDAESALERLVSVIRKELELPDFPVNILWNPDSIETSNAQSEA
jgi:hypothetical protein